MRYLSIDGHLTFIRWLIGQSLVSRTFKRRFQNQTTVYFMRTHMNSIRKTYEKKIVNYSLSIQILIKTSKQWEN